MNPIGVLTVLPEIKIHIIDGVVHGGVSSGVGGCEANAETVSIGSLEEIAGYSGWVDGSH